MFNSSECLRVLQTYSLSEWDHSETLVEGQGIDPLVALMIFFDKRIGHFCRLKIFFRTKTFFILTIPVRGSSSSISGWIVRPPVIKHKERNLTKYCDQTENYQRTDIPNRITLATVR